MVQESISGDMLVAEVLERVPNADELFRKHDIDPVTYCGPTIRILRLDEIPAHCKLEDLEGLLADLNQTLDEQRNTA